MAFGGSEQNGGCALPFHNWQRMNFAFYPPLSFEATNFYNSNKKKKKKKNLYFVKQHQLIVIASCLKLFNVFTNCLLWFI